eukprot:CAMPEP_0172615120 /NCGR_PEP_ID=MMETSP1068-20121228/55846_1 /TAXON_ID=35684 /ORGANISM="Pseudopedinella elastica, Strain CCMP716" /LENGTH=130 /DNA_ID=CAMNT_0013420151 /DNA_START=425 /DNA_END=817 /DNA_ORIENTATION=-
MHPNESASQVRWESRPCPTGLTTNPCPAICRHTSRRRCPFARSAATPDSLMAAHTARRVEMPARNRETTARAKIAKKRASRNDGKDIDPSSPPGDQVNKQRARKAHFPTCIGLLGQKSRTCGYHPNMPFM